MAKQKMTIREVQKIETHILKFIAEMCDKNNINYSLYCGSILGCVRHGGSIPWDTDVDIIISIEDYELFIKCCEQLPDYFILQYYPKDKKYNGLHPRIGIRGMDIEWIHVDVFLYSALPDGKPAQLSYIREARKRLSQYHKKSEIIFLKGNTFQNLWRTTFHAFRSALIKKSKAELFDEFSNYSRMYSLDTTNYVTEIGCNQYGEKKIFEKDLFKDTILKNYENMEVRIPKEYEKFLVEIYGNWKAYPPIEEQNRAANVAFEADSELISFLTSMHVFE